MRKHDPQPGYNQEMFEKPTPGRAGQSAPCREQAAPAPAAQLLERQLAPGETMLWQGAPQKLHSRMRGPAGRLFGFVWLGFACFWTVTAFTMTAGAGLFGVVFPAFGLVFVLVGVNMVFPQLFGGLYKHKVQYAVTDRRALAVTGSRVQSWTLESIVSVSKQYYPDGTGDLILENGQVRAVRHNGHMGYHNVTLEFLGVADVDAAEAALNRARER